MRHFVMREKEARDYRICEKDGEIEIRDGFNGNLVVQYYDERHRVIVYIPNEWRRRITVEAGGGTILCRQSVPCPGLQLLAAEGHVIYS